MNAEKLLGVGAPWLHVANFPISNTTDWGWDFQRCHSQRIVRFLRGSKMKTSRQLFAEVGAALQLPSYFGENWDALDECITDLSWLDASGYLLVCLASADTLSKEPASEWDTFISVLTDAGKEWSKPSGDGGIGGRPGVPFHVVLQESGERYLELRERLNLASVLYDEIRPSSDM